VRCKVLQKRWGEEKVLVRSECLCVDDLEGGKRLRGALVSRVGTEVAIRKRGEHEYLSNGGIKMGEQEEGEERREKREERRKD
jgi:hypothetical protein